MMCFKFLGLRGSGRSLPFIRKLQAYQIFRWVTASASLGGLKLPWVGSWKHLVIFQSSQFLPKWALIDSDCPHELTCSIFCPNSMAILGVLTVAVKAWCSFKVVSYARGIFGDPNSTKVLDLPFLKEVSHEMVSLETSRATLSSLWAHRIALVVVARCSVSDRSRCGAVLISIVKEILCRDLGKEVFYRELAQRSCHGDLFFLLLLLLLLWVLLLLLLLFLLNL